MGATAKKADKAVESASKPKPGAQRRGAVGASPKRKVGASKPVYTMDPSNDFLYMANPHRWDVYPLEDGGFEILPFVSKLEAEWGLEGVDENGDMSHAIVHRQKKGWVMIPADVTVTAFGEEREGYSHAFDTKYGENSAYIEVWRRPYQLGKELYYERDNEGYLDFLRMVRDEYLGPPDAEVLRALRAKFEEMRRTASGGAAKGSFAAGETVSQLEQKLTVLPGGKKKGKAAKASEGSEPPAAPPAAS